MFLRGYKNPKDQEIPDYPIFGSFEFPFVIKGEEKPQYRIKLFFFLFLTKKDHLHVRDICENKKERAERIFFRKG